MNFLVVNAEQAARIKARWWAAARLELKLWVFLFFFSSVMLGAFVAPAIWFLVVALIELILISRLFLWAAVLIGFIGYVLGSAAAAIGHPIYRPEPITVIFMVCSVSMTVRFIFWFFYVRGRF